MSDPKELAAELRRLRLARGGPTYEALARSTGLSRSTIADAFSGNRVPSERTLFAVVKALDEDPEEWMASREEIVSGREGDEADEPSPDAVAEDTLDTQPSPNGTISPETDEAEPPSVDDEADDSAPAEATEDAASTPPKPRRTVSMALLVPLLIVAVGLGAIGGRMWWPPADDGKLPGALTAPATGGNIFDTRCVDDGIVIASEDRDFDTQFAVSLSYVCNSVWARVYRYDGNTYGNGIRIVLSPKREGVDPGPAQEVREMDAQGVVTPMIVQNSAADRFCAEAWVTNDGEEYSLGDPICV